MGKECARSKVGLRAFRYVRFRQLHLVANNTRLLIRRRCHHNPHLTTLLKRKGFLIWIRCQRRFSRPRIQNVRRVDLLFENEPGRAFAGLMGRQHAGLDKPAYDERIHREVLGRFREGQSPLAGR